MLPVSGLLKAQQDNILTDFKLTLKDDNDTIDIDVHKIVLHLNCPYFKNYFEAFDNMRSMGDTIIVPMHT